MCRMACYLGPEIPLQQFLTEPSHSLLVQAHSPRELRFAKVNADGFGFGWYDDQGEPNLYVNTMPIWGDPNLSTLGRCLRSKLWMAHVRSATPGMATAIVNTQPFCDDSLMFMHNGFIRDFVPIKTRILRFIDESLLAKIRGTTDSEYIFVLLRHILDSEADLVVAIERLFDTLDDWIADSPALLNIFLSDGARIYAARHAVNDPSPSLYYTTDDENFPGAQLIASEAMTEAEFWRTVPEHSILVLDRDEPPVLVEF